MSDDVFNAVRLDPAEFRRRLLIDTDFGPRPLAECLDDWQRRDFESLDASWQRVAAAPEPAGGIAAKIGQLARRLAGDDQPGDGQAPSVVRRAYLERPRGHSKTADLAAMVTWVLLASPRRLSGVAAAADKDQARLLRDAAARLVALNTWLADFLDAQAYRITNLHTGSTLEILSADAASSYGLTPDFIVIDELTHWPREELWHSLLSSAAKRRHCLMVIIANAGLGQGESWQWKVRAAARNDESWYFSCLDGPVASWISAALLDEQRRLLPDQAFRRLWLNQWASGAGDALTADDIEAAVRAKGPMKGPETGCTFICAVDIGHRHDKTAVIVLAADGRTQTIRLAAVQEFSPGRADVNLMQVERCIVGLNQQFRLQTVVVDPSQAVLLVQRLRTAGIFAIEHPFTAANMTKAAAAMLDVFRSRRIVLYPHEGLLRGLRSLRIEERPNTSGFRLTAPRDKHGHADAAIALSIALPTALDWMQQGGVIDGYSQPPCELGGSIMGGGIPAYSGLPNPLGAPGPGNLPGFGGSMFGGSIVRF